jgi:hypothetical protein
LCSRRDRRLPELPADSRTMFRNGLQQPLPVGVLLQTAPDFVEARLRAMLIERAAGCA